MVSELTNQSFKITDAKKPQIYKPQKTMDREKKSYIQHWKEQFKESPLVLFKIEQGI